MAEEFAAPPADDVTDNDKLMAALSYPIPLVAIIILLVEDMKARPFQKYHAVQALAVNVAVWVIIILLSCILSLVTLGLCGVVPLILWFVTLYWAWEAYQGKYFEVKWVTNFLRDQNWL